MSEAIETFPAASLPSKPPIVAPESEEFWNATDEGRLLLKHCNACGEISWYPKAGCGACGSTDTGWREASGKGSIYSFSITRRTDSRFDCQLPYVLAYVELEEGPRVLTNIVDCEASDLAISAPVRVVFTKTDEQGSIYRFVLDR